MDKQEILKELLAIAEACIEGSAGINEAVALRAIVLALEAEES